MDPIDVFERDPASRLYSINALRNYLVFAVDRWDRDFADTYSDLAKKRSRWKAEYCSWFTRGYIKHVLHKDTLSLDRHEAQDILFPEYVLRTPLDIFIRLLEEDLVHKDDYLKILDGLCEFVMKGLANANANELWKVVEEIYSETTTLAAKISDVIMDTHFTPNLKELEKALRGQIAILKHEKGIFERNRANWPDRRAFEDETLCERLTDMRQILESNPAVTEIWRKGLRHVLIELQSSQKQYLFDVGKTRSAQNVRDRILCYVLLFDPKLGGNEDPDIKEWSAYDLFYYLTSLVPAEFQVRTMLADTMAEQYHGVYK